MKLFKRNKPFSLTLLLLVLLLSSCGEIPSSSSESSSSEPIPSEPSSSESSSSEDSSSSSSENEQIMLTTPTLSLNEDTGHVSFNAIENASYYRYYINDSEYYTTTNTVIELQNGNTISVMAESEDDSYRSSAWSNPITYYEKEIETKYVNIHFHNTNLTPASVLKGSTYKTPTPTKTNYEFQGWFLDAYYQQPLPADYIYNKNTILFAKFVADEWMKDCVYFIKANPLITSSVISTSTSSSGWRFIPLSFDESESKAKGKLIFSSIIEVNGTSSTKSADYIIMDGTNDDSGRTYYKDGANDFKIKQDGTYKICFSIEYSFNGKCSSITKIGDSSSLHNERSLPLFVLESSIELDTPILYVDSENECVTFEEVTNATHYEYQINNGEIISTTNRNIPLYQGSYITLRACSSESGYISSRWSIPVKQNIKTYPSSVNVYFYGSNRPNEQIPYNSKINRPINNPVKEHHTFIDWYKDITYTTKFDFDTLIKENTVIYAKFELIDHVQYELYESNKSTKLADFEVSKQYSYNEYVASYSVNKDLKVYVKDVDNNIYFGPYTMSQAGDYTMYFSPDHKWDLGTSNERNAYWMTSGEGSDGYTLYFSNNQYWSIVNYYVWDTNNNIKASWPGEKMTFVRQNSYNQDIYKCTFDTKYINIIFNNGSEQTVDISLKDIPSGTGFYLDSKSNGKWTVSTYTYGE